MTSPSPRLRVALVAVCALGSGCLVGPDFVPPDRGAPPVWRGPLDRGLAVDAPDEAALAQWWDALGDPVLSDLERRAAEANRDVAVAAARLREARAKRSGARAGLFPTSSAGGGVSRTRSAGASFGGITPPQTTRTNYDLSFDASWEIDLWGGLRRGAEAARADFAASAENLRAVRIGIAAEVAQAYADYRALQRRVALAEENVRAQSETLDLTRWRSEAGLTTELDVEQARANLEQTRAALPQLRAGVAADSARLAVLVGVAPGALDAQLAAPAPVPAPPAQVAVGVPADALARRPDVAQAERQLAAETARIGAAKAQALPRLSLSGSVGLESLAAGDLFSAASYTSRLVGNLTQVVLDFGRVKATIDAQKAVRDAALAQFEGTLLAALEDVENALVSYAQEQERRDSLAAAADAAQNAAHIARDQYAAGLVDFESVLSAERAQFSSQDQLAASEGLVASNLARVYKSLGGGWPREGAP